MAPVWLEANGWRMGDASGDRLSLHMVDENNRIITQLWFTEVFTALGWAKAVVTVHRLGDLLE